MKASASVPVTPMDFPPDVVGGPFRWTLTGPAGEQTQDTAGASAEFDLQPGSYTLTVQRFAADGATALGPASNAASFTVDAPATVSIEVVAGDITVTFS